MIATLVICVVFFGLAVWSLRRPGIALALMLTMFGFEQVLAAKSPFFEAHPPLVNIAVALVTLLAVGNAFLSGSYRFRGGLRPVSLAVFLYLLIFSVSAELAPFTSAQQVFKGHIGYLSVQLLILPLVLGKPQDASLPVKVAGWLCASLAVYILLDRSIWAQNPYRLSLALASGTQSLNPLSLGDVGGIAFILLTLSEGFSDLKQLKTLVKYAGCGAALAVTAMASRGEMIAALISTTLFFALSGFKKRTHLGTTVNLALVSLVSVGVLGAVLSTAVGTRYAQETLESSVVERAGLISTVWQRFVASPEDWLLGLGAGYGVRLTGTYPHNHVFQALTETGMLGLAVWLSIILLTALRFRQAWQRLGVHPEQLSTCSTLSALFLYYLLLSFKRGAVIDEALFMHAVLAERYALALREAEAPDSTPARHAHDVPAG